MQELKDLIPAPTPKQHHVTVSASLPKELATELDKLVTTLGVTRSKLIKVLVERALLDASSSS